MKMIILALAVCVSTPLTFASGRFESTRAPDLAPHAETGGTAGNSSAKSARKAERMEPKDVAALAAKNDAVIVDVRESEEREEVIDKARWMPMSKANDPAAWNEFLKALPKNKTIVFHCRSGRRSKIAAEKLASEGFDVGYFDGPDQWRSAGLPLVPGPAS